MLTETQSIKIVSSVGACLDRDIAEINHAVITHGRHFGLLAEVLELLKYLVDTESEEGRLEWPGTCVRERSLIGVERLLFAAAG